ncbi:MAG: thiamine pyrophosphate-dependent dehydrogenase E1 component subunit alpha [Christensenellaceae bacterium]
MQLTREKMADMMYKMYCARSFEERVNEMFMKGEIHGTTHLSIGQEGCAVGVVSATRKDDLMMSHHRGHSHCIAKDADINKMMAELLGKSTGFCKGMGGSMHIVDINSNNYGANGVIGPSIPIASGIALALKKDKSDKIIVDFFGDGTTNSGLFHEALNMASLWKLPIVYICENNLYGMSTSVQKSMAVKNVADRASAYNMPGVIVDGNDVLAIMAAVEEAAERARTGGGPTLIELKTYRWLGHSKSDKRAYRTREEEAEWKAKCPIKRFGAYMLTQGFTQDEIDALKAKAEKATADAVEFALASPELTLEEAKALVFAE